MTGAYWHLLINHFPIVLPLVGLPLAIYGAARPHASFQKLGLGILVLAAIFTGIAYLTGDPAADALEKYPGIVRASIDTHVLAAQWALRSAVIVGSFSAWLWGRCVKGRPPSKALWIFHVVVALWGFSVVVVTAGHGGAIRHVEIQSDNTSPP